MDWDAIKKGGQKGLSYGLAFLKWVTIAAAVGALMGLVGTLFHHTTELANEAFHRFSWLIWLLPAGGLLIVLLYRLMGVREDPGTDLVLLSVRSDEKVPLKMAPLIFAGTVITHLFGGSSGREGAALQLGASIAARFGRLLHLEERDLRVMTMCGMSACFSALFGTPVTAAIFSMEVISVGIMYYAAMVPCLIAAFAGFGISQLLGGAPAHYTLLQIPDFTVLNVGRSILLVLLCAVVSVLFCFILDVSRQLYRTHLKNLYLRVAVGGALLVALTFLVGTRDYNGTGMSVIAAAIGGHARPEAFLLKILFTAVTLGAGFKGGEIVPAFFTGAVFGNVVGGLLGLGSSFGAGIGLVAVFCGVTNCPMTSLILSLELFGAEGFYFFALASAASFMLSGYHGLYRAQRIVYSKIRTEWMGRKETP